jgi:hypothetical protein
MYGFRLVATWKFIIKLTENPPTMRRTGYIESKERILTDRKNKPIEVGMDGFRL